MSVGITFTLQSGIHKSEVPWPNQEISLRDLRLEAVKFMNKNVSIFMEGTLMRLNLQYPDHGLGASLENYLLLYRHDFRSENILQLLTLSDEITEGILVEVVISRTFVLEIPKVYASSFRRDCLKKKDCHRFPIFTLNHPFFRR